MPFSEIHYFNESVDLISLVLTMASVDMHLLPVCLNSGFMKLTSDFLNMHDNVDQGFSAINRVGTQRGSWGPGHHASLKVTKS